jgi:hypothetical protein
LDELQQVAEAKAVLKAKGDAITDQILVRELEEVGATMQPEETREDSNPDPTREEAPTIDPNKIGTAPSPLSDTMADMTEKEALEDLRRAGEDISDEALAAADPDNAAAEGAETEELF